MKKYKDLLVVDALITNENKSHQVKLTRSIANLDEVPVAETMAIVTISCNNGTEVTLKEIEPGIYKTDSTQFIVEIGKSYKLKIQTSDGKRYSSEECEILTPTVIDEVYFNRKDIINVNSEVQEGVSFFVNGEASSDAYLRWMYEEDWKFSIPYPTRIGFDENEELFYLPFQKLYCWKKSSSREIIVQSLNNQRSTEIIGKEICFIPSDDTDRFNVKYSVNVKQLNISQEEYNFWTKLKEASEEVGDIFGTQPFSITGNIKSDTDENEHVLGYFQTGGVISKRVFLDYRDVLNLQLSLRDSRPLCSLDTVMVDYNKYNSIYEIYSRLVLKEGRGLYDQPIGAFGPLNGLLITDISCSDCSLTGSRKKPIFWED